MAPIAACNIDSTECQEGAVCAPVGGDGLCAAYCDKLVSCGEIDADDAASCRDACREAREDHPEATEAGCQCVLDASCGRVDECDGAPDPSGSSGVGAASGGDGGSGADAGSGSGGDASGGSGPGSGGAGPGSGGAGPGSGGAGPGCGDGPACYPEQVCVEGACRWPCDASCECPRGSACDAGLCTPAPGGEPCSNDCDCTSGQQCVAGQCQ
jgi:hypothetical protein